MRDPPTEAWKRVQRYASRMRRVGVGDLAEDTFRKLRLNSPAGGWFPVLHRLYWCITESNLPYVDLFFSQYLKEVTISPPRSWVRSGVPRDILPAIASTISALPSTTLQSLWIAYTVPWADLKASLSSVALHCGPSLTEFTSLIPLSDAAINHLTHLPNLRIWRLKGHPPDYSTLPLPPTFPPLTEFTLWGGATRGWLSLFERLEGGVPSAQGVTPLSRIKESLKSLEFEDSPGFIIDASFTSTIRTFGNLSFLLVQIDCHDEDYEGRCPFKLDDENVTKFAMALPQLEYLFLGRPCSKNTCATTVACLLPLSVYCPELDELEIHFNTTNIVNDLKNISEDPRFQTLRSLPRCSLEYLGAWKLPLTIDEADLDAVVNGMVDIFPTVGRCDPAEENLDWEEFSEGIVDIGGS